MMYCIAIDYGSEGWILEDFKEVEDVVKFIKKGNIYGKFRVFKELEVSVLTDVELEED